MKRCCHCKEQKPLDGFNLDKGKSDGRAVTCKDCRAKQRKSHRAADPLKYDLPKKIWRQKNLDKYANYKYRSVHGISKDEMLELLEKQGGGCAICKTTVPNGKGQWHIDHDHNCCPSGKSCNNCRRGILCNNCNLMIGLAGDNETVLASAIEYLSNYKMEKINAYI
jgi:hypothetical protein